MEEVSEWVSLYHYDGGQSGEMEGAHSESMGDD